MAMDGFRDGLDWVDNTWTQGVKICLRQRTVQMTGACREGFGGLRSEDFRDTVSSFPSCLLMSLALFGIVDTQLAQRRVVAALGKFRTVPHQKLLAWLQRFDGVEKDVQAALARNQVLLLHGARWVDVPHPVAPLLVQTIQDVV